MSKFTDNVKKHWGHIVYVAFGVLALVVAVSGSQTASDACQSNPSCKAAYDAGVRPAPVETSGTTVPATAE